MSASLHRAEAGPSNVGHQRNHPQQQTQPTASPLSWTMSLFGGRTTKASHHTKSTGLGWGRPGAAAAAFDRDEREALVSSGGDDFDDSDAISLLSNIADRDSRRGGSAAARRRARAIANAQGRTCGTFFFDLEDWGRAMSCGLLGRNGHRGGVDAGRQRAASIGSVMSRGARRTNASTSSTSVVATSRHSRSLSNASTDSAESLVGPGFVESGDEDAGMLDDQDIAQFGKPTSSSTSHAGAEAEAAAARTQTEAAAAAAADAKAKAKAEAESRAKAERQQALEAEAARLQAEAEAEAARQKEEESRLAAEEEAAIAKARRKAERKAAKAGLLNLQHETQAAKTWRTEAEAEAAAGGFTFTDVEEEHNYNKEAGEETYAQQHFNYHDADYGEEGEMYGAEYDQYGDAEEAEGYYATVEERGPGRVVHHHHYYHAPPQTAEGEQHGYLSPNVGAGAFAGVSIEKNAQHEEVAAAADKTVSEDEADIAGLSFGRKKSGSRRNDNGSASGSRSGNGLTARDISSHAGGSSSGGSASGYHGPTSASSSSGRPSYRDRPRRHERTSSKSSNSSSGIFSYQSSNALHPPSTVTTSVVSPLALPNLYESEAIYASAAEEGKNEGETGDEVAGAQFGKPDVDANEFGVITAGTNKGGAGRVKKSYRDKRPKSQAGGGEDEGDRFEGFPGF